MKIRSIILLFLPLFIALRGEVSADPSKPLTLGVSLPLTGTVAGMGQAFQRGMTLFQEQHPDEASAIKVIFDDHKYEGTAVSNSCGKFMNVDKVDLLVVWGNTPASICAPLAERAHAPTLVVSMNPDAKDRSYVVSIGPRIEGLVRMIVEYFHSIGAQNPAALSINIGTALEGVAMVKKGLNGHLIEKKIGNDDHDFKSVIASLKAEKVDAALLFLLPDQAMTFARQAKDLHFVVPFIGGDIFADEEFQRKFLELLPSLAFVYGAVKPTFPAEFRKRFNDGSYIFEAATGYTTMELATRIVSYRRDHLTPNPLEALKAVSLADTAMQGLKLVTDPEFGTHIESSYTTYRLER